MRSNNCKNWSKGKQINTLQRIRERLFNLGFTQVVYSINTSSAQSRDKTPYEIVFSRKPRSDMEMGRLLSKKPIADEEDLL